jgi:hypothetical protein
MNKMKRTWLAHVKEYPIMMGVGLPPRQFPVYSEDQLLHNIMLNLHTDIFTSVHPVEPRTHNIFNKLYFDIDKLKGDEDLFGSFMDTQRFHWWLDTKGYSHRVYFSGNKGFNVYIDFDDTKIEDYSDRMEAFIEHVKKQLGIERLDLGVCKDVARISRMPYSINTKSGRLCVPVDMDTLSYFDLCEHNQSSFAPDIDRVSYLNDKIQFVKSYLKFKFKKKVFLPKSQPAFSDLGTTIRFILDSADTIPEGARHNAIWKILIPAMILAKYKDDDIIAKIKGYFKKVFGKYEQSDHTWVTKQISSCKRKGIFPMGLSRFRYEYGWN